MDSRNNNQVMLISKIITPCSFGYHAYGAVHICIRAALVKQYRTYQDGGAKGIIDLLMHCIRSSIEGILSVQRRIALKK